MDEIRHLFVYGTLAPGRANEHVLQNVGGSWQDAGVRGRLYPKGWGASMGYPAIVIDEDSDEVEGFLFSSEQLPEHWPMLDEFEGDAYRRERVKVKLRDGSTIIACIYALRER